MKTKQLSFKTPSLSNAQLDPLAAIDPNLILVFAAPAFFADAAAHQALLSRFAGCRILGCSTAGEISANGVADNSVVVTAARLEQSRMVTGRTDLNGMDDSKAAGQRLAQQIAEADLRLVLVFGQGVNINGTALVDGMTEVLGTGVPITGGLAADQGAFQKTWTLDNHGASSQAIIVIGFSGEHLHIGHGSFGGWETFGPARKVTRCEGNVLFELDGEPALEIYKRYLGDYAKDLPGSGLLFPFAMLGEDQNAIGLIRTILGIDETQGSLTLAGEITQNGYLKLMHASTDNLVDGAETAAKDVFAMGHHDTPTLAILVSCIGRKLVMGDRVDDEVEAVADILGDNALCTGFYSNGEISPFTPGVSCKLHNQTMTITSLTEA